MPSLPLRSWRARVASLWLSRYQTKILEIAKLLQAQRVDVLYVQRQRNPLRAAIRPAVEDKVLFSSVSSGIVLITGSVAANLDFFQIPRVPRYRVLIRCNNYG